MAELLTASSLADFLRQGEGRLFTRGRCDCCLWACDWIAQLRGRDPAASLRGRYSTARGAERHLRRAGGLLALARRLMAEHGFAEIGNSEVVSGDVGIVLDGLGREVMAVRDDDVWAVKAEQGVLYEDLPMLAAWRI